MKRMIPQCKAYTKYFFVEIQFDRRLACKSLATNELMAFPTCFRVKINSNGLPTYIDRGILAASPRCPITNH